MKIFVETVSTPMINGVFFLGISEYITMGLPPGGMVDLLGEGLRHPGFALFRGIKNTVAPCCEQHKGSGSQAIAVPWSGLSWLGGTRNTKKQVFLDLYRPHFGRLDLERIEAFTIMLGLIEEESCGVVHTLSSPRRTGLDGRDRQHHQTGVGRTTQSLIPPSPLWGGRVDKSNQLLGPIQ